jgi:maltooligosyltrehalose trehalohydrolase
MRSKLDWSELSAESHQALLSWYRDLIALRKAYPELAGPRLDRVTVDFDEEARWIVVHRGTLRVAANLGYSPLSVRLAPGRVLLASHDAIELSDGELALPPQSLAIVQT